MALLHLVDGVVLCVVLFSVKEHQTADWLGIHQQICPLIQTLRTLPPAFGADEELKRKATGTDLAVAPRALRVDRPSV